MTRPRLIIGRVETAKGGEQVLSPISHEKVVLDHQRKTAALIAAAYLYRDEPTTEHLTALLRAARTL